LKAAQHALTGAGEAAPEGTAPLFALASGQVSQLIVNQYAATAEERYKVWPTNEDREPFAAVMNADAAAGVVGQTSRMADAYRYFRGKMRTWLVESEPERRARALASALTDHLRLIVLDLDDSDEPQAIFETLNAHGTPLLPADLIKNWLLWQATRQDLDSQDLYVRFWRTFDVEHEYWRAEIGRGHAARPRVDIFLQYWLTLATTEIVPVRHLYDRFLAHALASAAQQPGGRLDVAALMQDLHRAAGHFREADAPHGTDALARSLQRLARLDYVVFRPVLMGLLGRLGRDSEEMLRSAQALESYLLRRMICGYQTRSYSTLALDLLKAIATTPQGASVTDSVVGVLDAGPKTPNEWPGDEVFHRNWVGKNFYNYFKRDRVLMMLQAIEEHYHALATKAEPFLTFNFDALTIEHIMPQKWEAHWPLPEGGDAQARHAAVQNVGNLTLVSEALNPSLSNGPWVNASGVGAKRSGLERHSKLELNRRLLAAAPDSWDEAQISARAAELFKVARAIWPTPSTFSASQQAAAVA
jgi:hypothetical protein